MNKQKHEQLSNLKNNNCQPRNEQIEQTCNLETNEQQSNNNEWTSESQLNGVCV